jgi:hypothetical protein
MRLEGLGKLKKIEWPHRNSNLRHSYLLLTENMYENEVDIL